MPPPPPSSSFFPLVGVSRARKTRSCRNISFRHALSASVVSVVVCAGRGFVVPGEGHGKPLEEQRASFIDQVWSEAI